MEVMVKILVENTTPSIKYQGEYGFSALVKVDGRSILFDTGFRNALLVNAPAAGVDLAEIGDLVISHGHYDHTGAVLPFLHTGGSKRIFAHPRLFLPRYVGSGLARRSIGVDFSEHQLTAAGATIAYIDEFTEIYPGVHLSGEIPRTNEYEDVGGDFWAGGDDHLDHDNLEDDMALVLSHPQGLIVISGCAHAGIINTLNFAAAKTGQNKILAFIGGTHLMYASEHRLEQTLNALRDLDVQTLVVCHCTGFKAAAVLYTRLGPRVIKGETGMAFHF